MSNQKKKKYKFKLIYDNKSTEVKGFYDEDTLEKLQNAIHTNFGVPPKLQICII